MRTEATQSLIGLEMLDEGLPLLAATEEAWARRPTFFAPIAADSRKTSTPRIGFILLMLLVGASAAALVFHTQLSQLW